MSAERPGPSDEAVAVLAAMDQRLYAAAAAAGLDTVARHPDDPARSAGTNLAVLLNACSGESGSAFAWLALTAVHGVMPTADEITHLQRSAQLQPGVQLATAMLDDLLDQPPAIEASLEMDVIVDSVVVNADFCARYETHTGIQRVVRETLRRWDESHELTATANTDSYRALRHLAPRERHRVLAFDLPELIDHEAERAYRPRLVAPWRCTVVIPEVPSPTFSSVLAALAELSGNTVSIVGYDMIPLVSAELRPFKDTVTFGRYLSAVKHCHTVAAISSSAQLEFAGFADALIAQGLSGPAVHEVSLPYDTPPSEGATMPPRSGLNVVLCVGSLEHHKNHQAVFFAAETLWREGLDFTLELIGQPGWDSASTMAQIAQLEAAGRPLVNRGRASDEDLWEAYRHARFSVFVSLHEGFGLPVAESLSCGTPVLTSDIGSMAEIAEGGGCLTVDPEDDGAIVSAMRRLLTDDVLVDDLTAQAHARPPRRWEDYADDLWSVLTAPTEAGGRR